MVSFRLSPEEHQKLKDTCVLQGMRSISDMARFAMQMLIAKDEAAPLSDEVRDLRNRVGALSQQLEKLATAVNAGRSKSEESERKQ